MKHEQHPLDQFLKEKLAERSFDYQDAYWDAASALIDQQRRRRPAFWIWLLAGIGLLGGAAGLGWSLFAPAPSSDSSLLWRASLFPGDWEFPDSCLMSQDLMIVEAGDLPLEVPFLAESFSYDRKPGRSGQLLPDEPFPGIISSQQLYNMSRRPESKVPEGFEERVELEAMKARAYALTTRLFKHPDWLVLSDWKQHRHSLGLTAGLQLAPAWRSDQPASRPSFSPVIGGYYRYALSPTVRFQASLLYRQRSQLFQDTSFTSVEFGFGNTQNITTLSGQSLHFLSLPLSIDLAIGQRQHLSVGIEPSYLVGVRTNVLDQTLEDGLLTASEQESTWQYPQGYERLDVAFQVGYHHYLGQGIRIGTVASYGYRDLTNDDFFTAGNYDRQVNWRLWLEYDLRTFGKKK